MKTVSIEGLGQFPKSLEKELKELLSDPEFKAFLNYVQRKGAPVRSSQKESFIEKLQLAISDSVDDPPVSSAISGFQNSLEGALQHVRTNKNSGRVPLQLIEGDETPMIDLSGSTDNDLRFLLSLFTTSDPQSSADRLPRDQLVHQLTAFLPRVRVQIPPESTSKATNCSSCKVKFGLFKRQRSCFACGERFCTRCPLRQRISPCTGTTSPQDVCNKCFSRLDKQEVNLWVEAGIKAIRAGTIQAVRAAHGSFAMALHSAVDSTQPILKLTRELLDLGWPDMALNLVVSLLHSFQDPEVSVKANFLAAKALSSLANQPGLGWGESWVLAMAAKEALVTGASTLELQCPSLVVPELETRRNEVNSTLHRLCARKEQDHDHTVADTLQQLEQAWKSRDWNQLLVVVVAERKGESNCFLNEADTTIEALQQFLAAKETFFDRMLHEDRFPLLLLRGVVKLHYNRFSEGLADIEAAAWSGHHSKWLTKAAVDIVLCLLAKSSESCKLPFQVLHEVCQDLTLASVFSSNGGSLSQLLPKADELIPPFKHHWPELIISGMNMKATRKYEQAVEKQVQQGKWSERDAALAYIDLIPGCNHPAEVGVCFLIAGLWFLKELRLKVSASQEQSKLTKSDGNSTSRKGTKARTPISHEVYAIKKMVLECIGQAYLVAHRALHPGMRLYISRLALRASLTAVQLSGDHATPQDSAIIIELLQTIAYTSRFSPFCNMPIVSVSEAVLLNIIAGRLHSQFLLGLQHVSPQDILPIRDSELRYQLYENDLRHVCPLDDSASARARAMEGMLHEKGWSWVDVAELMTSPLSPRSDEGWLVQQPQLGTHMEYAEITGFVFNLKPGEASIQLLVKPADRMNPGLFSQSDVTEVLHLPAGGMYFSLEAPSRNEQFHPFQEFKYKPDKLQGTDFLHTMFETDYLLKSFSVGADVSSNPPFHQRPSSEGLTAKLPPKLRSAIRPVAERGTTHSRVHRFWIQAEELVYDQDQSNSRLVFHLAKPKMGIRSHPLAPGLDRRLRDTAEDDDPNSPEAQFAADLTKHYDDLGLHFPMFARLRELVKLQFLGIALESVLKELQDKAQGIGVVVPDSLLHTIQQDHRQQQRTQVESMLGELSRTVGVWPKATDETEVSSAVSNVRSQLPVYVDAWTIRPQVEAVLREQDQRVLSQLTDALMQTSQQRVSRSTLEYHVRNWLSGFSPQSKRKLMEVICAALPLISRSDIRQELLQHHVQVHSSFSRAVDRARGKPFQPGVSKASPCKWVPAALLQQQVSDDAFSLCYGGVLLAPEFRQSQVNPTQGSVHVTLNNSNRNGMPYSSLGRISVSSNSSRPPAASAGGGASGGGGSGRGGGGGKGGGSGGGGDGENGNGNGGERRSRFKASDYLLVAAAIGCSDELDHRWSQCFSEKPGHRNPQTRSELEQAMCDALELAQTETECYETWVGPMNPKAKESGHSYRVRDCELGQEWVQIDRKGEIRSYGINQCSDPRCLLNLLMTIWAFLERCLQAGIDPNTKISDARNILGSTDICSSGRCKCCNEMQPGNSIKSNTTGQLHNIDGHITCKSKKVLYVIGCKKCEMQYVGQTKNALHTRICAHRSDIRRRKTKKAIAAHFCQSDHSIEDFTVKGFLQFPDDCSTLDMNKIESYWIAKLGTLQPNGMNRDK